MIPITVLEELDRFKRGSEDIHFQARQFLRTLDSMVGSLVSDEGVSRGPGLGLLRVVWTPDLDERVRKAFLSDAPDHRILGTALTLQNQHPDRNVVLVSKDINLRMKAKSVGLVSEDYEADKLTSVDGLYNGKRVIDGVTSEEMKCFLGRRKSIDASEISRIQDPIPNENFIYRNGSRSLLLKYSGEDNQYCVIPKHQAYGIRPRNAEQHFALNVLLDTEIPLVTISGRAGTGKTLLALASALESQHRYEQILLARPIVPLSNRDLGFLPGDIDAKLEPYMQPLFDNLKVIRNQFQAAEKKIGRDRSNATGRKAVDYAIVLHPRSEPAEYVFHR